jgi:hypothetical protein
MSFELADNAYVSKHEREVQLLINIIEPDPEYQPFIITDEASLLDLVGNMEDEINEKLNFYFKQELSINLGLPLPKYIETLKIKFPGWPEKNVNEF